MKFIPFIFLVLVAVTDLSSQIKGKIVDGEYPLEYATAAVYNQRTGELIVGVITDSAGNFSIPEIKKGRYYLEASFIGFETKTVRDIEVESKNTSSDMGKYCAHYWCRSIERGRLRGRAIDHDQSNTIFNDTILNRIYSNVGSSRSLEL